MYAIRSYYAYADDDAVTSSDDPGLSGSAEISDSEIVLSERAHERDEGWTPSDDEDEEPFAFTLVRVLADMEPFMGVDGRTYEIATGDILTLPGRNAEVLAERDIVLNIRITSYNVCYTKLLRTRLVSEHQRAGRIL